MLYEKSGEIASLRLCSGQHIALLLAKSVFLLSFKCMHKL